MQGILVPTTVPIRRVHGRTISLSSNFAWMFTGNVVHAACGWGVLIVLAKLGSAEALGLYSLGLAIAMPVSMLASLNLRSVLATDTRGQHEFEDYLGLRVLLSLLVPASGLAICRIVGYSKATTAVILAVCMAQVFDSVSDIYYGLLQRSECMFRIAVSMMMKGVFSLAALGVLFYMTSDVLWGAVGFALARVLILVCYDGRSDRYLYARGVGRRAHAGFRACWNPRVFAHLTRLALPLGIVLMFVHLTGNIPRYFIERQLGPRQLGIYAALFSLFSIGNTVTTALGQAALPRLARFFADGNLNGFYVLLLRLMALGALLGIGGVVAAVLFGQEVVTILYRPEYAKYKVELVGIMLMAAIAYIGQFTGVGLTAARYFKCQIWWTMAVAAAVAGFCHVLVPAHGLRGAVLAMIFAMALHCLIGFSLMIYAIRRHAAFARAAA